MLLGPDSDIPCFSKLAFNRNPLSIDLSIHCDVAFRETDFRLYNLPDFVPERFGLAQYSEFSSAPDADWGFNGALVLLPAVSEFVIYRITIPKVKKQSTERCVFCDGSGHDDIFDRDCCSCHGTGFPDYYDRSEIGPISASLTLLGKILHQYKYGDFRTNAKTSQLICLETVTDTSRSPPDHGVWGQYRNVFVDWLRQKGETRFDEPTEAMILAHERMIGIDKYDKALTYVRTQENGGWLSVSVPGDRCCLHPESSWVPKEGGYEFSNHNMDHPWQQLTALAGLAALEMQARNELGF